MNRSGLFCRRAVISFLAILLAAVVQVGVFAAQPQPEAAAARGDRPVIHLLGVAIGLGMVVIGAGLGIGKLAAAAAEGIARQPSAAAQITGAVNLPLFLLEGVAILAEVFALLVLFLANPF
jgi:F-type H+-transporting ATPase subunit c